MDFQKSESENFNFKDDKKFAGNTFTKESKKKYNDIDRVNYEDNTTNKLKDFFTNPTSESKSIKKSSSNKLNNNNNNSNNPFNNNMYIEKSKIEENKENANTKSKIKI